MEKLRHRKEKYHHWQVGRTEHIYTSVPQTVESLGDSWIHNIMRVTKREV